MLSPARIAAKKHKAELRRKKVRKKHMEEANLMARGDFKTMGEVRKRRLRIRRKHHMPKQGVVS